MQRVLLVYATSEGQTAKIAGHVAQVLRARGLEVEVHQLAASAEGGLPEITPERAVVLGGSLHVGQIQPALIDFARANREALEGVPTAFFLVCLAAAGDDDASRANAAKGIADFEAATGLDPNEEIAFAGALKYRTYGLFKRFFMRLIAGSGGLSTDTSRDHEYTDWALVDAFAHGFADHLTDLGVRGPGSASARRPEA
jgi:menaquinone-dependent protoporphyrinogen oxidase